MFGHTLACLAAKTAEKVDRDKCCSPTLEEKSKKITDEASKSSSTSATGTKQVTLFDCCSAKPHAQVAGRQRKEKRSLGKGEQDKSYKGTKAATATLNGGRNAKMSLSLRRKQPQEVGPLQHQPTSASSTSRPIPLQRAEDDSDGEQSLKHSKPLHRLQPMRAAKRLKVVLDQTVEEGDEEENDDDEDYFSVCSSQPSPTKPKRMNPSPVTDVRSSITRARKISFSSRNEEDEDSEDFDTAAKCASPLCSQPEPVMKSEANEEDEDFESSPRYSSPLRKLPRRALKNEGNDSDDEDFESSPKYSSPLRKRQGQAAKRLKFGADFGNGTAEAVESLCKPLPLNVPELDGGTPGGDSRRGLSINIERVVSLEGDKMDTPAVDSSARRDGGRSSDRKGTDTPSQSSSAISTQSSIDMEHPLPLSKQCSSSEQPVAAGPVQLSSRQSQGHSSRQQSSKDLKSTAESFQQLLAGEVHVRVLSHTVEFLEKQRRYQEACALLRFLLAQSKHGCSSRGQWFDRLALNLDFHLKQQKEVSMN